MCSRPLLFLRARLARLSLGAALATPFVSASASAQTPAFPGAEGFGRFASGGRGGEVYRVTNLNDSGPGSLREGVLNRSVGVPRTIVFAISGTIHLQSTLRIIDGDLTIAGQTAPGDGICLARHPVDVSNSSNVILRFIRSRLGDTAGKENDAFSCRYATNVIVDHCSFSWAVDETASAYDNTNFTMQWCIVSESLRDSVHSKGPHGYGAIWGGLGASFHHNLLAHHDSRNPRFNGARTHGTADELVDMRNNVVYNWRGNSTYGGEPTDGGVPARHNQVNNTYKNGPATSATGAVRYRILEPTRNSASTGATLSLFHVAGNHATASAAVTTDNWDGGVQVVSASELVSIRADPPFAVPPVATQTAQASCSLVLAYAGCRLPARDPVDARVVDEVASGTATYRGSKNNLPGIIDSQADVGGWPTLASVSASADTDRDGMSDAWENAHGLDPALASDRNLVDPATGYTRLELYLAELAAPAFPLPTISGQPEGRTVEAGAPFTLSVSASAPVETGVLGYQWYRDGSPVDGATTASYSVSSASAAHAGDYHVVVKNDYGAVVSAAAVLAVERVGVLVFSTDFAADTIHAATPALSPTATNWHVMSSKNATGSAVGDDLATPDLVDSRLDLVMGPTSSGVVEGAAFFASPALSLAAAGDLLRLRAIVVTTNIRTLAFGVFDSGGSPPHTGMNNGQLSSSSTTFAAAGTQDWRGYRAWLDGAAAPPAATLEARLAQPGTNNASQSLLVPGTSSSAPTIAPVASAPAPDFAFADGAVYTLTLELRRADEGGLDLRHTLHAGLDTAAAPLASVSAEIDSAQAATTAFDAVALGHRNRDGVGSSRLRVTFLSVRLESATAASPDAYEDFVTGHGLDPASTGALSADPDGDGVSNAFEFLLGASPVSPASAPAPVLLPAGGGIPAFDFVYERRKDHADLFDLVLELSSDLEHWRVAPTPGDGVEVTVTSLDTTMERCAARVPLDGSRVFARLRATAR